MPSFVWGRPKNVGRELSVLKLTQILDLFFSTGLTINVSTWHQLIVYQHLQRTFKLGTKKEKSMCLLIIYLVYSDETSCFEKLLETNRFVPIQTGNLQILATEIFKVKRDLELTIFGKLLLFSLHKISKFHLFFRCRKFMESHSFHIVSGDLHYTKKLGEVTVFYVVPLKKGNTQYNLCHASHAYVLNVRNTFHGT